MSNNHLLLDVFTEIWELVLTMLNNLSMLDYLCRLWEIGIDQLNNCRIPSNFTTSPPSIHEAGITQISEEKENKNWLAFHLCITLNHIKLYCNILTKRRK